LLSAACCLLPAACHLLSAICRLLSAVCCLPCCCLFCVPPQCSAKASSFPPSLHYPHKYDRMRSLQVLQRTTRGWQRRRATQLAN
jgi:hypothetical protein